MLYYFFFNDDATTEIYTLSLHDALPISADGFLVMGSVWWLGYGLKPTAFKGKNDDATAWEIIESTMGAVYLRSEEHTSELQSHVNLVCRLLLEKKKDI